MKLVTTSLSLQEPLRYIVLFPMPLIAERLPHSDRFRQSFPGLFLAESGIHSISQGWLFLFLYPLQRYCPLPSVLRL